MPNQKTGLEQHLHGESNPGSKLYHAFDKSSIKDNPLTNTVLEFSTFFISGQQFYIYEFVKYAPLKSKIRVHLSFLS